MNEDKDHRVFFVFSAILTAITGLCLLFAPLRSMIVFVSILGLYLVAEGAVNIITAFMRRKEVPGWGWLLFNGILLFIVGLLFMSSHFEAPLLSTLFTLGMLQLFLGISMLVSGIVYLKLNAENRIPGVLRVIAGVLFAISYAYPAGALFLVMFAGASLVVNGVVAIALHIKNSKTENPE